MEIKEIFMKSVEPAVTTADSSKSINNHAPLINEKTEKGNVSLDNTDVVQINKRAVPTSPVTQIASSITMLEETTDTLSKIVDSLAGITELAANRSLADNRRRALAQEASSLVEESDKLFKNNLLQPTGNDKDSIRQELERTIGKALSLLLPETLKEKITFTTFSNKQAIIETQASIENYRQTLKELEKQIAVYKETTIRRVKEDRQSSLPTNIDQALELARNTKSSISQNGQSALAGIGTLNGKTYLGDQNN